MEDGPLNVTARLTRVAQAMPDAIAVVEPLGYDRDGKRRYRHLTFRELEDDSSRIAGGLRALGVTPGTRLALLVRPGIDFLSLVVALLKAGAVVVLIDPGMGRRNLIRCLAEAEPDGFVAISLVHAVRALLKRRFPKARMLVTVGRRWFWGGVTLDQLRKTPLDGSPSASTQADDPAAIIFTTGSTGPPKGVLYTHANLDAQIEEIQSHYQIRPGEIDLPCFPIFGLFNCAMGVTAVIPDMDPSHPARVDPAKIVEAVGDWNVTQAFASPAVLARVGPYCRARGLRLASVRRVLSAGAPVQAAVLAAMKDCIHPEGDIYTPYGATEALPVASIAASEVLAETAARTRQGAGVCVGRKFARIAWKVIRIVDGPVPTLAEAEELPAGEIGELIVQGPVVTRQYVTRREANALGKIADGREVWHRMGDAGYLDEQGRFWFCGRVAHRVVTAAGPMYTIPCEAIFNQHPEVRRSALVGIGPAGQQSPAIVLEPLERRLLRSPPERERLIAEVRQLGQTSRLTAAIRDFLFHEEFPVDVRHNAKIFREKLAVWAARKLPTGALVRR
jgi:acyl-CoA synthetase (AMP-forming)/AMP-acid ligase II